MTKNNIKFKRREFLDKSRIESSNTLDKYLLSFATASIYLSLYFRKDLAEQLIHKNILIASWVFLVGCIILTLLSFKLSEKAHERQIEIIDEQIKGNDCSQQNCWSIILEYTNSLSITLFIAGIVLLLVFVTYNLK